MASIEPPGDAGRSTWSCCARTCRRRWRRRATRRKPGEDKEKDKKDGQDRKRQEARTRRAKDDAKAAEGVVKVTIDLERIGQRTLALPIPAGTTRRSRPARRGSSSCSRTRACHLVADEGPATSERRPRSTWTSARPRSWSRESADVEPRRRRREDALQAGRRVGRRRHRRARQGGRGRRCKVAEAEVYVDPRAEWRQMYHETWRIERDFFYDPGFHGLDLQAAEKHVRAVGRGPREPRRPELPLRGDAGRADPRPRLRRRRRPARGAEGEGRAARRRLHASRTAATASRASTTARTGTPSCARRSPSRA